MYDVQLDVMNNVRELLYITCAQQTIPKHETLYQYEIPIVANHSI